MSTFTVIGKQHGGAVTRYIHAISAFEAGLRARRDEIEVLAVIIGRHENEWAKVGA